MRTHQQKAASFIIVAFSAVILVISASTSFGFFFEYFNSLIPPSLVGGMIAAIIGGAYGTALFDVATAVWLNTFLNHAETAERRAICLIMSFVTFLGAAAASVAHLSLTATGGRIIIDPGASQTIGLVALVTVIAGTILNFGAILAYQRYSQEKKESVRESDRRDEIQKAEDEQARYLDNLIARDVKDILAQQAPALARLQAERIASQFYQHESAKYGGDGRTEETAVRPTPSRNGQPEENFT